METKDMILMHYSAYIFKFFVSLYIAIEALLAGCFVRSIF